MMDSVNWSQATLIFVVVLAVGVVPLSRILMEKTVTDVSNINRTQLFVGPFSAIAIDLQAGTLFYVRVFSKMVISIKPEDLAVEGRLEYELKDTRPSGFLVPLVHSALSGNQLLSISTNLYELPEISIAFSNRDDAQRCLISLREFVNQPKCEPDKDVLREKLVVALNKRTPDGAKMKKRIGKPECRDHIIFIKDNMQLICGRPLARGDGQLIAEAMFAVFGRGDDDPSDSGYTLNSLISEVSRTKASTNGKFVS